MSRRGLTLSMFCLLAWASLARAEETSGLLLGLREPARLDHEVPRPDRYRTLWIAPAHGRVRVAAKGRDVVVPAREGFWRVQEHEKAKGLSAAPVGAAPQIWENNPCTMFSPSDRKRASRETYEIRFVSPEVVSIGGDYWFECASQGFADSDVITFRLDARLEALPVSTLGPGAPAAQEAAMRRLEEEDLCFPWKRPTNWAITRRPGRWVVVTRLWCDSRLDPVWKEEELALPAPTALTGHDRLVPGWETIAAAVPKATDAFASPAGDLLVVLVPGELRVFRPRGETLGPAVLSAPLRKGETAVMAQWAAGRHVDRWTRELRRILKP